MISEQAESTLQLTLLRYTKSQPVIIGEVAKLEILTTDQNYTIQQNVERKNKTVDFCRTMTTFENFSTSQIKSRGAGARK